MKRSDKLRIALESHINPEGFVTASPYSDNKDMTTYEWIGRDAGMIYRAVSAPYKAKIMNGVRTFMKIRESHEFISPIVEKNFKRPNKGWSYDQKDSVGWMLYMACDQKDKKLANIFVNYLESKGFWKNGDSGIWEGDSILEYDKQKFQKRLRVSTLSICGMGLEHYEKQFGKSHKTTGLLGLCYDAVEKILPHECLKTETEGAQLYNAALFFSLWPNPILPIRENKKMQKTILNNLLTLEKRYGFIRFPKDRWDGNNHTVKKGDEMQWVFFNDLAYMITKNITFLEESREIREKYGYMPEGIKKVQTGEKRAKWESNNTHLLEAEAVHILAEETYEIAA